jgi:hypothetical protein
LKNTIQHFFYFPQAEQFTEWEQQLVAQVDKSITKLRGYEIFLGQCLSLKAIEIRKREVEALRQERAPDFCDCPLSLV